ncbi:MAG: IscS subfamily cysteine desulfurase [Clostridia bacterium]|nr:IscS subfamily cysteine desulfurase [Clostridia bacterium]
MIYADNAATTRMSEAAIEAMVSCLRESFGNPSSLYAYGQQAKELLEGARAQIAGLLGAQPSEIIFTSGGSEADNQALLSMAEAGARRGKKHIVSTAFEHHAVLHTLERLKKQGFEITLLDVHKNGIVRPEELENAIRSDTCLVSVMYANNEIGTLQPIRSIGEICTRRGVPFHTDAVQAVGHVHIDVKADNIDLLSLSAHKFHGPKGIGALYARRGLVLQPLINGGAQERNKRAGTENVAAIVAMAAALTESCAAIDANAARLLPLRRRLIHGLRSIPYSELNGDEEKRLPGSVSFCFEGIEGESLLLLLDDRGICASSGSACTSGSLDPSHVLLAIGRPHEVAHGSLRLSLGEDATQEDVDEIIRAVTDTVAYLRGMSPFWRDLECGRRTHVFAEREV